MNTRKRRFHSPLLRTIFRFSAPPTAPMPHTSRPQTQFPIHITIAQLQRPLPSHVIAPSTSRPLIHSVDGGFSHERFVFLLPFQTRHAHDCSSSLRKPLSSRRTNSNHPSIAVKDRRCWKKCGTYLIARLWRSISQTCPSSHYW
jgi:hypothetical protein